MLYKKEQEKPISNQKPIFSIFYAIINLFKGQSLSTVCIAGFANFCDHPLNSLSIPKLHLCGPYTNSFEYIFQYETNLQHNLLNCSSDKNLKNTLQQKAS